MPDIIDVEIKCVNGVITCFPDPFEVKEKDHVKWSCPGDPEDNFIVIVPKKGAFDWKVRDKKCGQIINEPIKNGATPDTYKYHVIVTQGPDLCTADPIFIVKPP